MYVRDDYSTLFSYQHFPSVNKTWSSWHYMVRFFTWSLKQWQITRPWLTYTIRSCTFLLSTYVFYPFRDKSLYELKPRHCHRLQHVASLTLVFCCSYSKRLGSFPASAEKMVAGSPPATAKQSTKHAIPLPPMTTRRLPQGSITTLKASNIGDWHLKTFAERRGSSAKESNVTTSLDELTCMWAAGHHTYPNICG